jgi:hypothetical protein
MTEQATEQASDPQPEKNPRAEAGRRGGLTKAANRRAARKAAQAQADALAHPILETPDDVKAYLRLILAGAASGSIQARAAAASAAVAARLLKAMELDILAELKELRLLREQWERETQGGGGVTRRRR